MSEGTVPYIGSRISLISKSEIRYEGTLYTINTQESTVALQHGNYLAHEKHHFACSRNAVRNFPSLFTSP